MTAVSTDRQTIELTNRTDRTWYFTVAGWQLDQFETCPALGEYVVVRGPIAPGTTPTRLMSTRRPAIAVELSSVVPLAS